MRSPGLARMVWGFAAAGLLHCSGQPLPAPPAPEAFSSPAPPAAVAPPTPSTLSPPAPNAFPASSAATPDVASHEPIPTATFDSSAAAPALEYMPSEQHCAGVPPLGPDGTPPPAPPHTRLGHDVDVPGDKPIYWLPGDSGDPRVIVYLHGLCGDVSAADFFREAVRKHGSLLGLRGDTACPGERFKWRDGPSEMHRRILRALQRAQELRGGGLDISRVLLFGYSQGADRAEKLAERYPQLFSRVVLGGPPMRASPTRLARASAVAILGGELETTENMQAGAQALAAAGIRSRFFMLDCAYHGWYGSSAEEQLSEVLQWISTP
jgi:predicted esterase